MSAIDDVTGRGGSMVRTRARCVASAAALAFAVALITIAHLFAASHSAGGVRSAAAMVLLITLASFAGVTPTAYVALDMFRRRQWLPAAASTSIAMLVAFVVFWSCSLAAAPRPAEVTMRPVVVATLTAFDRAAWLGDVSVRPRMARDLAGRDLLLGMTRSQVLYQLGVPTATSGHDGCDMFYRLGTPDAGKAIDLHVVLTDAGIVHLVSIETTTTSVSATPTAR